MLSEYSSTIVLLLGLDSSHGRGRGRYLIWTCDTVGSDRGLKRLLLTCDHFSTSELFETSGTGYHVGFNNF